jgi:hypothetical protein
MSVLGSANAGNARDSVIAVERKNFIGGIPLVEIVGENDKAGIVVKS